MTPRIMAHAALLAVCTIHAAVGQPVRPGGAGPEAAGAADRVGAARQDARATPEVQAARRALAEAARETMGVLQQRLDAGEAMTPTLVELSCQTYRRLCLAEHAAAEDEPGRQKALAEYLDRMKKLHEIVDQRFKAGVDVSRVQVTQVNYYVREAELWLAESKQH